MRARAAAGEEHREDKHVFPSENQTGKFLSGNKHIRKGNESRKKGLEIETDLSVWGQVSSSSPRATVTAADIFHAMAAQL